MADCHIGGWRDPKLKELSIKAFNQAVDKCIEKNVAFVIIAGDLFNTAVPNIDLIAKTADILRKLRDNNIEVYVVPGSHDFSPSGKTMLDVLERAGLLKNVFLIENEKLKFTVDKTNVKLTGLLGLRNNLEKSFYQNLGYLDEEDGFKIFVFHTTIDEIKPKDMDMVEGQNFSMLPKSFNYYAGGHIHCVCSKELNNGKISYPGPLFPNNFKELEELEKGGFFIVDDKLNMERIDIDLYGVRKYKFNVDGKSIEQIENEIIDIIKDFENTILLIRIYGTLKSGKPSDLNLNRLNVYFEKAFTVLFNTNKLTSEDIKEQDVKETFEEIEKEVIMKTDQNEFMDVLIDSLNEEKSEGEKTFDFESRLFSNFIKKMKLEEIFKDETK